MPHLGFNRFVHSVDHGYAAVKMIGSSAFLPAMDEMRDAMDACTPATMFAGVPAAQILFTIGDHFEGLHIQRGRSR